VGEPVNRVITLSATGLPASILPALPDMAQQGVKFYQDPPETTETATSDGLVSLRAEVTAIVPTQEGELILPAIRIPWWNTRKNQLEEALIPAHRYPISGDGEALTGPAGAPFQSSGTVSSMDAQSTLSTPAGNPWFYTSLALAAVCGLLITYILRRPTMLTAQPGASDSDARSPSLAQEDTQYRRFVGACHRRDATAIRHELFLWVKRIQPDQHSLTDFARSLQSPALQSAISDLEAHLYSPDTSAGFDANALLEAIAAARQQLLKKQGDENHALAPLNP